jgi:hypothetical protein
MSHFQVPTLCQVLDAGPGTHGRGSSTACPRHAATVSLVTTHGTRESGRLSRNGGCPPTVSASAHDSKKCFSQGGGEHTSQRKPTACGLHASTLCLLGERTQRPVHAAISRVRLSQRPASPIQPVPAQPAWPGCCHAPSSMQTRGGAAPSADQLWRLTGAGCAACDAGFSRQRSGSTPSCLGRLLPSCLSFI